MRKKLAICLSLSLLLGLFAIPLSASAEEALPSYVYNFDDMTALPTTAEVGLDPAEKMDGTPGAIAVSHNPTTEENPYSLVTEGSGKAVMYKATASSANSQHHLDILLYGVPNQNVTVTADIRSDGTLKPMVLVYDETWTALGSLKTDGATSYKKVSLTFNMGNRDQVMLRFAMGSDGSDQYHSRNGVSYVDNISITGARTTPNYNLISTPAAGTKIPVNPTATVGEWQLNEDTSAYSFDQVDGTTALHYKNGTGNKYAYYMANVQPNTEYVFKAKLKVTAVSGTYDDARVLFYAVPWAVLGPQGPNSPDDWTIESLLPTGGYKAGDSYGLGGTQNGASTCATEWKNVEFTVKSGDSKQMGIAFYFGAAYNNQSGEFYLKDMSLEPKVKPELLKPGTPKVQLPDGTSIILTDAVRENDFTFEIESAYNAPTSFSVNGKGMAPGQDYLATRVSTAPDAYTVTLKKAFIDGLKDGDQLTLGFANGETFTATIIEKKPGLIQKLTLTDAEGTNLISEFGAGTKEYVIKAIHGQGELTLNLTALNAQETIKVNGNDYTGGDLKIQLQEGENKIVIELSEAAEGAQPTVTGTYTITVNYNPDEMPTPPTGYGSLLPIAGLALAAGILVAVSRRKKD